MKKVWIWLLISLAGAINCVAGNNDWPKVKTDCGQVTSPPPPPPDSPPGAKGEPLWKRFAGCATDFFTARPAHLTVKSIVPGGGFGPGITFSNEFNHDKWQRNFTATGVSSLREFWLGEARLEATHPKFGNRNEESKRFKLDFYANALEFLCYPVRHFEDLRAISRIPTHAAEKYNK